MKTSDNQRLTRLHTDAIDRINDLLITLQDDTALIYREKIDKLTALLTDGIENIERVEGSLGPRDGRYGAWIAEVRAAFGKI